MSETSNVIKHPHRSLRRLQAERLKGLFLTRGKTQPNILARLSCTVEKLNDEAKERFGPRSGAMQRAFGEELVRMKGRFTARDGVPPTQIYQTPEAWLRVINGFATVMGRDPDSEVVSALEDALSDEASAATQGKPAGWLDELLALVGPMVDRLRGEVDLVELADYVARSGLILGDDGVSVSEWPFDHVGHSQDELYLPHFIGLVPHAFGLNYVPVTSRGFAMADFRDTLCSDIRELAPLDPAILAATSDFTFNEGIRTGIALAVHADSRQLEAAMVEWHHADVALVNADGKVIATIETRADLHELVGGDVLEVDRAGWIGTPDSFGAFRKPGGWVANTVRFHFPGSAGFERLASSLIVRPWIWSDPAEHDFWAPGPEDADACPVISARHSVAGAIEGNLLYADAHGQPQHRLDRLLLAEIRRVSGLVDRFRTAHEARRLANREVLLAQWNTERQR